MQIFFKMYYLTNLYEEQDGLEITMRCLFLSANITHYKILYLQKIKSLHFIMISFHIELNILIWKYLFDRFKVLFKTNYIGIR